MSSCLVRSASVAQQGSMADPRWGMRVDNTFIVVGPKRSTSLDGFFRQRQVRSCPGRMSRQRRSSGQSHSRGRYPRSASRGCLGRSQARDLRVAISGAAHRLPSTDRSSTRSSSLMSRSGRRVGACIRTPSSSLSRCEGAQPLRVGPSEELNEVTQRWICPTCLAVADRLAECCACYAMDDFTAARRASTGDFGDALSPEEARKSSDSKRSGPHDPKTPHLCTSCGEFGGTEDNFLACAICSEARAEQRSHVSGHGVVMVTGESELFQSQTTKRMYECESQAPLLSDQTDTLTLACGSQMRNSCNTFFRSLWLPSKWSEAESDHNAQSALFWPLFSRCKLSWSLALLFIFSIALCSRSSMCTRNAPGDLPISGSICTGQLASACEGADFPAKVPTVTFEAYQDAIEGIKGLFARFDELQPEFGSTREILGDELRRRFTEMLERVKKSSTRGGDVLEALEAVQIFEFHADLALFVERLEDDALVPSPAPFARSRFNNIGGAQLGYGVPSLGTSTFSPNIDVRSAIPSQPPPVQQHFGIPDPVPSPPFMDVSRSPKRRRRQSNNGQNLVLRMQNAMRNSVSVNANYKSLLPRVGSLPRHLLDEIARREQQFDEALLSLQSRGVAFFKYTNEMDINVEESDEGLHLAASAFADAPPSFLQSSWQYVFDLEAYVQAQAAFTRDVEAALQHKGASVY